LKVKLVGGPIEVTSWFFDQFELDDVMLCVTSGPGSLFRQVTESPTVTVRPAGLNTCLPLTVVISTGWSLGAACAPDEVATSSTISPAGKARAAAASRRRTDTVSHRRDWPRQGPGVASIA
jgi:hypothetical protein